MLWRETDGHRLHVLTDRPWARPSACGRPSATGRCADAPLLSNQTTLSSRTRGARPYQPPPERDGVDGEVSDQAQVMVHVLQAAQHLRTERQGRVDGRGGARAATQPS